MALNRRERFLRRRLRNRNRIRRVSDRCRLSVFLSGRNLYAQVIDDSAGRTLAAASTLESDLGLRGRSTVQAARAIGALLAERALAAGIKEVVFDRGGYRYHGRVRELAEAARGAGLEF